MRLSSEFESGVRDNTGRGTQTKTLSMRKGFGDSTGLRNYCPVASEDALAPSLTLAGALQAFAAVLNADHAEVRAVRHDFVAFLRAVLNADHAALIPVLTWEGIPLAYACCNAVARAL